MISAILDHLPIIGYRRRLRRRLARLRQQSTGALRNEGPKSLSHPIDNTLRRSMMGEEVEMARIALIWDYEVRTYGDTGQTVAIASWTDSKGKHGRTTGKPTSTHMVALRERAIREGTDIQETEWEWGGRGVSVMRIQREPKFGPVPHKGPSLICFMGDHSLCSKADCTCTCHKERKS